MRIFLTGATGFIGSHLLELLLKNNINIAILTRPETNPWRITKLLDHCTVIFGDLANTNSFSKEFSQFQPDTIIHLAWEGVGNKDRNNLEQFNNTATTLELIKLAHKTNVKSFIGLGSQAEYGPCEHKINENKPTLPTTQYGLAKLATCLTTKKLCEDFKIRFAWLRLFSSYGPKDSPEWMIPYLIKTLSKKEKPSLTACEQLWDFIYVQDVANAIFHVAKTHEAQGIFNLGSGTAHPLSTVVKNIRDYIDPKLPLGIGEIPYRPDQVMHLEADITRLKDLTHWQPQVSIKDGLLATVKSFINPD